MTDIRENVEVVTRPLSSSIELVALIKWIQQFPYFYRMCESDKIGNFNSSLQWLQKQEVAIGILRVTNEVCSKYPSPDNYKAPLSSPRTFSSVEQIWEKICQELEAIPSDAHPFSLEGKSKTKILSLLLCLAVADKCSQRTLYIKRILAINDSESKHALMKIIKAGIEVSDESQTIESRDTESELHGEFISYASSFLSNDNKISVVTNEEPVVRPHPRKSTHEREKRDEFQRLVLNLQKENSNLLDQLKLAKFNEESLTQRLELQTAEQISKDLKNETKQINIEKGITESYLKEIAGLKILLVEAKSYESNLKDAKTKIMHLEGVIFSKEKDQEKLGIIEEQLKHYKTKLADFNDVRDHLKQEENAHSEAVNRCLELESELHQLGSKHKQLERLVGKSSDAVTKLAEQEAEIKMLKERNDSFHKIIRTHEEASKFQQAEIEHLTKKVLDTEAFFNHLGGDDNTDLDNQESTFLNGERMLVDEMVRLRKENIKLKAFQSYCSQEYLTELEENVAKSKNEVLDVQSRCSNVEEELKSTMYKLSKSELREEKLKKDLISMRKEGAKMLKRLQESKEGLNPDMQIQMKKDCMTRIEKIRTKAKKEVEKIERSMRSIIDDELSLASKEHKKNVKTLKEEFAEREKILCDENIYLAKAKKEKKKIFSLAKAKIDSYKRKLAISRKRQEELENLIDTKAMGSDAKKRVQNKGPYSSPTLKSYIPTNLFLSPGDMMTLESSEKESIKKEELQIERGGKRDQNKIDKVTTSRALNKNLMVKSEPKHNSKSEIAKNPNNVPLSFEDSNNLLRQVPQKGVLPHKSFMQTPVPQDIDVSHLSRLSDEDLSEMATSSNEDDNRKPREINQTNAIVANDETDSKKRAKQMLREKRQLQSSGHNPVSNSGLKMTKSKELALFKAYLGPRPDPNSRESKKQRELREMLSLSNTGLAFVM